MPHRPPEVKFLFRALELWAPRPDVQPGDDVELFADCGHSLGWVRVEEVLPNGDLTFFIASECHWPRDP